MSRLVTPNLRLCENTTNRYKLKILQKLPIITSNIPMVVSAEWWLGNIGRVSLMAEFLVP